MRRWLPLLGGSLLLALLPLFLSGVHPREELLAHHDGGDPLLQAAILQHALEGLPWPWAQERWEAPFLYPAPLPLAGMDPLLAQALPLRPLSGLRGEWALAANLALAGQLFLAALLGALLLRRLGLRGAWLAGATFAWVAGPYAVGHWHHLNQLPSPWVPLALLGLLDWSAGRARGPLLLLVACLAQLASGLYGMAALGLFLGVAVVALGRGRRRPQWGQLAAVGLLVGLATWAWAQPYAEASRTEPGYERGAGNVGPFAARVGDLDNVAPAHLLPWPRGTPGRPVLYPGLGALLLAGLGLGWQWRQPRSRQRSLVLATVVASAAALLLAAGRSHPLPGTTAELAMPYAWLQDQLWPLRALRAPSRFLMPATLVLAMLAAMGAAAGWRRWQHPVGRVAWSALLLLALLDLAPGPAGKVRAAPTAGEAALVEALARGAGEQPWVLAPLPCREQDETAAEARAMLWAVASGQPLAGGRSGYVPAALAALRRSCCGSVAAAGCRRGLDSLGVRRVVQPAGAPPPGPSMPLHIGPEWALYELRRPEEMQR